MKHVSLISGILEILGQVSTFIRMCAKSIVAFFLQEYYQKIGGMQVLL